MVGELKSALDHASSGPARVSSHDETSGRVAPKAYVINTIQLRNHGRLRTQVVDGRDLVGITTIDAVDEFLDEDRSDVAKDVLDGLILNLGVLNGDGALKDATR
jgi:hypothetical protein